MLYLFFKIMAISQARSKRKMTGGRYISQRGKRKYELGRFSTLTKVGITKVKKQRTRGGNVKNKSLSLGDVNVLDTKSKKSQKVKILSVTENAANRHYIRRQILTKGAIVKTDIGDVRVTNRPGQEGFASGILLKKEK